MIKKRSLVVVILLSIITCGIYGMYFIYKLAKDMNTICEGDGKKTRGLLFVLIIGAITAGIYSLFWLYALGDRMQENGSRYGLTIKESGTTILLWDLLGAFIVVGPFIALHIIIKNINALGEAYNSKNAGEAAA
jgi:hypothetical protein